MPEFIVTVLAPGSPHPNTAPMARSLVLIMTPKVGHQLSKAQGGRRASAGHRQLRRVLFDLEINTGGGDQ